ncbi:hypothetical protein HDA41_004228 [Streptomyces caelestis]|jgi:phosphatidylinositol alpha-1,6-mannosyltransferase|uniref:Uncharacterized protein n=1 Tax=Streptomyces caelestis TaxID=36816 RepID=A0A7W9H5T3_9ACTN|nr:hypothetical protein [Streptomyces caelestis]
MGRKGREWVRGDWGWDRTHGHLMSLLGVD